MQLQKCIFMTGKSQHIWRLVPNFAEHRDQAAKKTHKIGTLPGNRMGSLLMIK